MRDIARLCVDSIILIIICFIHWWSVIISNIYVSNILLKVLNLIIPSSITWHFRFPVGNIKGAFHQQRGDGKSLSSEDIVNKHHHYYFSWNHNLGDKRILLPIFSHYICVLVIFITTFPYLGWHWGHQWALLDWSHSLPT